MSSSQACPPPPIGNNDTLDALLSSVNVELTFPGMDFLQDNLNGGITDPFDSYTECSGLCQDHPNCTHWSWVQDGTKAGIGAVFDR